MHMPTKMSSHYPALPSPLLLAGHSCLENFADGAAKLFDIRGYRERYIALEVMYIGWSYLGSTYQPNEPNTVEVSC